MAPRGRSSETQNVADTERIARYREQGHIDRAAEIMRREGVNARDAFERAAVRTVGARNALIPEQFDAAYGKGAHDEVHGAATSQSGRDGAGQRAQGPATHDGETGASVRRSEGAGHAAEGKGTGPASEAAGARPTRTARAPADERAPGPHQVDESASGDAPARDDHEQIVDKWRKVRKPLPVNASAQRKDVIRGYRRELSKLGLLNAKTEGEVRNRLMDRDGERLQATEPEISKRIGAAPPGTPPPSVTRTADLTKPRPAGGVSDSKGSATMPGEVRSQGDARRTPTRIRDKAGGADSASFNDTHGAQSGAVSDSGEPGGRPAENEPASATAAESGGIDVALTYMPKWTSAQRANATAKAKILNDGETAARQTKRSGNSAARIFKNSGGHVPARSDVDHAIDLQLGGPDVVENMWSLDSSVNRSLGAQIRHRIKNLRPGTVINKVTIGDR